MSSPTNNKRKQDPEADGLARAGVAGVYSVRKRRLVFLLLAGFIAAVSLLIGLTTAQRAQSAAGDVWVIRTDSTGKLAETKKRNLSSIEQTDADCNGRDGYSIGAVFQLANISTSVSNLKLIEIHKSANATQMDFPDFVVMQPEIAAGSDSCPYNMTMSSSRTYFNWGTDSSQQVGSNDRITIFTAHEVPFAYSPAKPKAGKRVDFKLPPMHTSDYKFRWEIPAEKVKTAWSNGKTAISHTFKTEGKYQVIVRVKGNGLDVRGFTTINVGGDPSDDKNENNNGSGTGGNGTGTGGTGTGSGTGTGTGGYTPTPTSPIPTSPTPTPVDPIEPVEPVDPVDEVLPEEETYEQYSDPNLTTISGIPIASTGAFLPGGGTTDSATPLDETPLPTAVETPMLVPEADGLGIPPVAWFALMTILLVGLGVALEFGLIRFGWLRESWLNLRYKLGI